MKEGEKSRQRQRIAPEFCLLEWILKISVNRVKDNDNDDERRRRKKRKKVRAKVMIRRAHRHLGWKTDAVAAEPRRIERKLSPEEKAKKQSLLFPNAEILSLMMKNCQLTRVSLSVWSSANLSSSLFLLPFLFSEQWSRSICLLPLFLFLICFSPELNFLSNTHSQTPSHTHIWRLYTFSLFPSVSHCALSFTRWWLSGLIKFKSYYLFISLLSAVAGIGSVAVA